MPDETNTDAGAEAEATNAPQAQPKTYPEDLVKTLREEAKERRLENKALKAELEELRGKVAQTPSVETVSKLEALLEKETKAREEAAAKAAAAEHTALRLKIATEAGLPAALASKLSGDSEDELRADAESLKPFVVTPQTGPQRPGGSTTPVPGGAPQGETDAQRIKRIMQGNGARNFWSSND